MSDIVEYTDCEEAAPALCEHDPAPSGWWSKPRNRFFLIGLLVVLLLAGLITAFALRNTTSNVLPPPTETPEESSPIDSPTATPESSTGSTEASVSTPSTDIPSIERLIDFFSDQDPATASDLLDTESPQYRAMAWLAQDVQQNQYTFASASDRIVQRGVLAVFYHSTFGATQWANSTSWLDSAASECTWYGVTCADGTTTVTSLILKDNNLVGELPRELGLLSTLEELTMFENTIGGTIPSTFGQLTLLKTLSLDYNALFGSIPDAIGQLLNLEYLDLNDNSLVGNIPNNFTFMSHLKSLWLKNNNLSGPIPLSITAAISLTSLYLDGNALTGTIPSEIGFLIRMQEMNLYSNQLTGSLPTELGELVDCNFLVLAQNQFLGPIPATLGFAESMVGISVTNNIMTGTIPSTLGLLLDLRFLQLDGNEFTGVMPAEICDLNLPVNDANSLVADCEGPNPEIECTCCSNCPPSWGG